MFDQFYVNFNILPNVFIVPLDIKFLLVFVANTRADIKPNIESCFFNMILLI
jgi:hypothetical protein